MFRNVESELVKVAGKSRLRLILGDANGRAQLTPDLLNYLVQSIEGAHEADFITLEGIPGSFCDGLDLEVLTSPQHDMTDSIPYLTVKQLGQLLALINQAPCPVIALVDGPARGGGVGLVAAADLVLASSQASFALPEALLGLIPAVIFPQVALRLGLPRARLLALSGLPLSAARALEVGLVDEITDDLEAALGRYASRFSRMDRRALAAIKSLSATLFETLPEYSANASSRFFELCRSQETQLRVTRFLSGETPWPEEDTR